MLCRYAELQQNGEVLHGEQLENMYVLLSGMEGSVSAGELDYSPIRPIDEEQAHIDAEISTLEKEIKQVQLRRDQLGLESMRMCSQLEESMAQCQAQQSRVSQQQAASLAAAQELTDGFSKLSHQMDKLTAVIRKIASANRHYLVSADLSDWQLEEQRLTQTLKHFVRKQFPQGCLDTLALEGPEQDELSLVAGEGAEAHARHTAELHRLHALIERSELAAVRREVREARLRAEIEESAKAMERVKRGYYGELSDTAILQDTERAEVQHSVASEEVRRQEKTAEGLVREVAERHATATLTANAITKITRQKYYLGKLCSVQQGLVRQLSRQNYLAILVQCEAERIRQGVEQLQGAHSFLLQHQQQTAARTHHLRELGEQLEEERALGRLPPPLRALGQLLDATEDTNAPSTAATIINATFAISHSSEVRHYPTLL